MFTNKTTYSLMSKNYRLLSIGTAPFAANKQYKDYYITQIQESEKIKK